MVKAASYLTHTKSWISSLQNVGLGIFQATWIGIKFRIRLKLVLNILEITFEAKKNLGKNNFTASAATIDGMVLIAEGVFRIRVCFADFGASPFWWTKCGRDSMFQILTTCRLWLDILMLTILWTNKQLYHAKFLILTYNILLVLRVTIILDKFMIKKLIPCYFLLPCYNACWYCINSSHFFNSPLWNNALHRHMLVVNFLKVVTTALINF